MIVMAAEVVVSPSPKYQSCLVCVEELSEKVVGVPRQVVVAKNFALGLALIVTFIISESLQPLLLLSTIFTVPVPAAFQVTSMESVPAPNTIFPPLTVQV